MLTEEVEKMGLGEVLGIENSPEDVRDEILSKAVAIVETRALTEILKQLDESEQEMLVGFFEQQDGEGVVKLLSGKGIDLSALLEKEVLKIKNEYAEKAEAVIA
ncbi:MAG: hypothetical protein OYG31_00300 [Candidatus Kaiserbacteria bacterium]|nr:hypothetical protein [Candidatus Kaiserbacteria bacterium]